MKTPANSALMDYEQVAALLQVKIGTLYAWVHQDRIPHIRFGPRMIRFDRNQLMQWIDQHRSDIGHSSSNIKHR